MRIWGAVLLSGLGLVARAASRETGVVLHAVDASILTITGAEGPPSLTCDEARAAAKAAKAARGPLPPPPVPVVKPPPSTASAEPDYAAMDAVVVDGKSRKPKDLPGADPTTLPPQPLEGPPEALDRIATVLKKAEAGERVRISVFGASHVGGDYWTGRIRRALQDRYGDLGHGFVLPASLYEGDRGQDINVCRTEGWLPDWTGRRGGWQDGLLGFAGMSVSSADPTDFGWVETTHTNPHGRAVSAYEVFALGQPEGGSLLLTVDAGQTRTVSTLAATPTLLRWRIPVPDGGHRLTLAPLGDGQVRLFGVSAEREGAGVLVDAMGVRGRMANSWLAWDRTVADQGLLALNPDMVVLAYGTNEAADTGYPMDTYRADLSAVLTELRRALPDVACALVGPSDRAVKRGTSTWAVWSRSAAVAAVQREVAPRFGCAFWDMQQASGGPGSMVAWRLHEPALAAPDLIHFAPKGYEILADRFLAALDELRPSKG